MCEPRSVTRAWLCAEGPLRCGLWPGLPGARRGTQRPAPLHRRRPLRGACSKPCSGTGRSPLIVPATERWLCAFRRPHRPAQFDREILFITRYKRRGNHQDVFLRVVCAYGTKGRRVCGFERGFLLTNESRVIWKGQFGPGRKLRWPEGRLYVFMHLTGGPLCPLQRVPCS